MAGNNRAVQVSGGILRRGVGEVGRGCGDGRAAGRDSGAGQGGPGRSGAAHSAVRVSKWVNESSCPAWGNRRRAGKDHSRNGSGPAVSARVPGGCNASCPRPVSLRAVASGARRVHPARARFSPVLPRYRSVNIILPRFTI